MAGRKLNSRSYKPGIQDERTAPIPAGSRREAHGRIFLLSPANAAGRRAQLLTNESAHFELAARLRREGLPLDEAFSFISGLYFRGKLAYARAFAQPPKRMRGIYVITASGGLIPPEQMIRRDELQTLCSVPIDPANPQYRLPLERDARTLAACAGDRCQIVLLGSIATQKYAEPLLGVFGERLLFPAEFAGRGDMIRGAMMLRCARAGVQLAYVPLATSPRHARRAGKQKEIGG